MKNRREMLALATGASLFLAYRASAQEDGLGSKWFVHEEVPGGRFWEGVWIRRGHSRIFDANWTDSETGGVVTDVLKIVYFDGGNVRFYRFGNSGTYFGSVSPNERWARGSTSWYPRGAFWRARIAE